MNIQPIRNPQEVVSRLEQLQVTKEQLLEAVAAAVGGRNSCTRFDPRSAPGWSSWKDGNRRLREILVPLGWDMDEAEGIPSVIHRQLRVKITLCNTDAGTGLVHYHPQQTTKKGAATDQIVSINQSVFDVVLNSALNANPVVQNRNGFLTCWYLCVYCEGDDVRAELSCPIECNDGYFRDFSERIFLISDTDDSGGPRVNKVVPAPDGGDGGFEIPVERKQSAL
jgi:hypothetical protein